MTYMRTTASDEGLSLVTGIGRQPLTRRQAASLGQILGTVRPSDSKR